jgi:acetyltransferase-like isoleucine patch superfamily enzyme/mannose-6-phosphate isomerase-like protein (cupin superfamily)
MADFFLHPNGLCESATVGPGTRIWAFAHVLPGARIGADCNICDGVFVENDVVVGDRVTVKCGVQLWDGVTLEDDVFVGPNATFTNDPRPRSRQRPERFSRTVVRRGASIGANATILPGLEIGQQAMVGAGAVVTRSVPPFAVAVGNPARIVGYVGSEGPQAAKRAADVEPPAAAGAVGVGASALYELPLVKDLRGNLSVGEFERSVPFRPKRYFLVFDVPSKEVRGEHAHKRCDQFLICVRGSCAVVVDDGMHRREVALDRPNLGLLIPAGVWGIQYKYSADAVLLVFASDYYDPDDYIRSYAEFQRWLGQRGG